MIRSVSNSVFSQLQASIPLHLNEVSAHLQALTSRIRASAVCLIEGSFSIASSSYLSIREVADRFVIFDALSAATALTILDKFSLEELRDVLLSSQFFFSNERNIFSRAAIISAVAASSIDQRQNVLIYARPLITESMTSDEKSWLIRSIAAQEIDRRGYFLASTFFTLITEDMPELEKLVMEQAIDPIAIEERGDVFAHTQILISNRMNGFERRAIMVAIASISSEERIEVLSLTGRLVTDSMMGYEKEQIINAITAVSVEDRREVFACAQAFITEAMSGFERSDIIFTIARLSSQERIHIQLIAEDRSDFIRAEIILRLRQRRRPLFVYEALTRQFPSKNPAARKLCFTKQQNPI